jgi:thiosulfate dehydrogenase [quinone] large subunit
MGERVPLAILLPLRLLVGAMLAVSGYQKFQGGWLHGTPLMNILDGWIEAHKTYAFFIPMVQTAHAHPKIFGTLVTAGELVIGAALVLGLLTRLVSFLGMLMLFSFALGAGQGLSPPGNAILMGAILFLFVLAPPGRIAGIDRLLAGRLPRWMI